MKRRPRAGFIVVAGVVAWVIGACGEILNVDGIELVPPSTGGAGSGGAGGGAGAGAGGESACAVGSFHCEGPALQLCEEGEPVYRTVRVCSTAELCCDTPELCNGQPGCQAPVCSAGERRCRGALLEGCNEGQTGFTPLDECASALHCNASRGRCTDQPCDAAAREAQCNGPNLEECLPGRSEWSLIDTCATQGLCDATARSCLPASCRIGNSGSPPSPYLCASGNLMRCNDEQTAWEYVETCLNTANCNPLLETLVGDPYAPAMPTEQLQRLGCSPPACTPGRYQCDRADLMLCGANRTGYTDRADRCDDPRSCDATLGRCSPVPCTIGEHQCSGDQFQICTAAGWSLEALCSSGAPCDPVAGCLDAACGPNEYRCDGADLQRCNVERTGWIPVRTCETEGLCNVAAKRCDPPACTSGAPRCTAAGVLERCAAERNSWATVADCAAQVALPTGLNPSALCDPSGAGQCLPSASCAAGAYRCNAAELERCRDNAWRPFERCATPAQCDAGTGTCLPAACEPGSFRCVSPTDPSAAVPEEASRLGLALQACNDAGTAFEPVATCGALERCDEVHGQCDICDPTLPALCVGNELRVCTADGQELTLYEVCRQGCVEGVGSNRTTCREDLAAASAN